MVRKIRATRKTITKLTLERNPPKGVAYEEQRDANSPLILRVSSSGAKSFWVRTRVAGKGHPLRIPYPGPASIESLPEARVWAAKTVQDCKAGLDPRQTAEAKAKADALAAGQAERQKVRNVIADYIASIKAAKLRTADETERMFEVYVMPRWGERSVLDIDGDEINALLDDVAARKIVFEGRTYGGLVIADRLLRLIRACLKWYASKKNRKFHPPSTDGMERTNAHDAKRSRVLTDDEIRAAWAAAPADAFGGIVKTLLLTAQRRDEVGGMGRSEIDRHGNWTIPAERYKTKKPNVVPLTPAAVAVIDAQDQIDGGDMVFSTNGNTAFSGFTKCKLRLDRDMLAKLQEAAKERGDDPEKVTLREWRLHDLRRTAKTLMMRAGVRPDVSERVLGHVIKGVEGVYDQWEYAPEKRAALEALAALLDRINNPAVDNVVQLRAARMTCTQKEKAELREKERDQSTSRQHKQKIIDALRNGYERWQTATRPKSARQPALRLKPLGLESVNTSAGNITRLKGARALPVPGKKGRPVGAAAEDAVALLAPIYRRYTGANATASHPHIPKIKAKLIPFDNGTVKPKPETRRRVWTASGPFVDFVAAVAEACELFVGPDAVDKVIKMLREGGDGSVPMEAATPEEIAALSEGSDEFAYDPSPQAESKARFRSSYMTPGEPCLQKPGRAVA